MGERDGIADRRVAETNGRIDFGRWFMDTMRMWPILLLLGGVGWRAESTRSEVEAVQRDFIKYGPRVSTEGSRPTTIEAELEAFEKDLPKTFQTREIAALEMKNLRLIIEQIAEDVRETKGIVRAIHIKELQELAR